MQFEYGSENVKRKHRKQKLKSITFTFLFPKCTLTSQTYELSVKVLLNTKPKRTSNICTVCTKPGNTTKKHKERPLLSKPKRGHLLKQTKRGTLTHKIKRGTLTK